jgi:hypothetical protein
MLLDCCIFAQTQSDGKLTCTVVVESYLNDFVWPFSRKTFSTFAIGGMRTSLRENAEGCASRERANKIRKLLESMKITANYRKQR